MGSLASTPILKKQLLSIRGMKRSNEVNIPLISKPIPTSPGIYLFPMLVLPSAKFTQNTIH